MEFYDDMPVTKFFSDSSVVLSGDREQDAVTREWNFTERILYVSYMFDDKSISIGIFDDVTREYVLQPAYVKDYFTAAALLQKIATEYPSKVKEKDFLPKWKIYFEAMKETVQVESPITDTDGSCGQCGDYNRDEFIFLYTPAVPGTKLNEASLGVHWEYGCFGGTKIAGVYEDVVEAVTELVARMEESVLDEYRPEVEKALKTLEALAEAK